MFAAGEPPAAPAEPAVPVLPPDVAPPVAAPPEAPVIPATEADAPAELPPASPTDEPPPVDAPGAPAPATLPPAAVGLPAAPLPRPALPDTLPPVPVPPPGEPLGPVLQAAANRLQLALMIHFRAWLTVCPCGQHQPGKSRDVQDEKVARDEWTTHTTSVGQCRSEKNSVAQSLQQVRFSRFERVATSRQTAINPRTDNHSIRGVMRAKKHGLRIRTGWDFSPTLLSPCRFSDGNRRLALLPSTPTARAQN